VDPSLLLPREHVKKLTQLLISLLTVDNQFPEGSDVKLYSNTPSFANRKHKVARGKSFVFRLANNIH
jgi:hypothetical protein